MAAFNKKSIIIQRINQRINIINDLLNNYDFLTSLSTYSHNDFNTFIHNISLMINYYLNSNSFVVTEDIEYLFNRINSTTLINDYSFYPTNTYFKKMLRLNGLQLSSNTIPRYFLDLRTIEQIISMNCENKYPKPEVFTDLEPALTASLTYPSIFYESILKTPKTKEQSYKEDEETHYYSILQKRLENVPNALRESSTKKAHKWFNAFIGEKPLLVIFSKNLKSKDIKPVFLSYIELPTKYTLEQICQQNKEPKVNQPEPKKPKCYVLYSRYESLPINTEFTYSNEELTGDIDYDIDLIYGALDYNGTRAKISNEPYVNMQRIKDSYNIVVRKQNGQYEIKNGRHRLLYAKNYYVQNYDYYKSKDQLDFLRKLTSLIVNVEHYIEDEDINKLLKYLSTKYKAKFIKYDINNDEPGIIILIDDKAYVINNIDELSALINDLTSNNKSKYYLSDNEEDQPIDYSQIMNYLIITLKEQIYTMNFLDIIKYLLTNGYYIDNKHCLLTAIDYYTLYNKYISLQSMITLHKLQNKPLDIVNKTLSNIHLLEIGKIIIDIVKSKKYTLDLEWSELVPILKHNPSLQDIDSNTLLEAANLAGYQALRYQVLIKDNPSKLSKIW